MVFLQIHQVFKISSNSTVDKKGIVVDTISEELLNYLPAILEPASLPKIAGCVLVSLADSEVTTFTKQKVTICIRKSHNKI